MTRKWRIITWSVLVACFIVMLLIAFWPTPVDAEGGPGLREWLAWAHHYGLPRWFDYAFVESAANVVFFIPLGALITVELPRRLWWVGPATGAVFSMIIETVQIWMPDRVSSIADVIANTSGAILGSLAVVLVRRGVDRRSAVASAAAVGAASGAAADTSTTADYGRPRPR
ncbi:VanZ family protein [Plantibacter sp. Mn2098]|uniref:VanZ family protein n=1 Tax=Plantibacter sp. Mn2098 TaxID=3395266 RepID=UPI003BED86B3